MNTPELHRFYLEFVARLREHGVVCAITSGLACVHYGIAETTKDCDLLCHPDAFGLLLDEFGQTKINGLPCQYRGHLSPPLDERWHSGGWTSHFIWGRGPDAATFDVFGRALRGSVSWTGDLSGLFVSPHIVAEMKRTNRDKDWAFITDLGIYLVEEGDPRGWLHIFDEKALTGILREFPCPPDMTARRPALRFAMDKDARVAGALLAERLFWEQLDAKRIEIYQHALRPYNSAVRRRQIPDDLPLAEAHAIRIECAKTSLEANPLKNYGVARYLDEVKQSVITRHGLKEEAIDWLPDAAPNFNYLA
jgi:hypothetical protein